MAAPHRLDVLILGGGAAGLWLLDDLHRLGYSVALAEAGSLGSGQTIASQGIIHGGLKYALHGHAGKAARAIRGMPLRWRRSLAGERAPDLTPTRRRAEYCMIWAKPGLRSRLGLLGASLGLSVKPRALSPDSRPAVLRDWHGPVLRLGEQVIEPGSFLQVLADQHLSRILRVDGPQGIEIEATREGHVREAHLRCPGGQMMTIQPQHLVLAAGEGNSRIRNRLGLPVEHIQKRPLQMVMACGNLPLLNGHCIRNASPWLTITSTRDHADRVVWQIGGQVAEDMARTSSTQAIDRAIHDLKLALPDLDHVDTRFATYLASRAEGSSSGRRPNRPTALLEENVITAWP
ncbi:MAG: FAD-dependent oxidoreductase, partial [Planctomycetota bacterium]|nr:FAD-dependent oxidoreductase [Planctomycetota bacterium]